MQMVKERHLVAISLDRFECGRDNDISPFRISLFFWRSAISHKIKKSPRFNYSNDNKNFKTEPTPNYVLSLP